MEIGFKGVNHIKGAPNGTNILWRRKWFYFSEKQYLKVSPNLFGLQYLCQETWHKWKTSKNPFVRVENKSFRRLGENIILREQGIHFPWKTFIRCRHFLGGKES